MGLSLKQSRAVCDLADSLYGFLPGLGNTLKAQRGEHRGQRSGGT